MLGFLGVVLGGGPRGQAVLFLRTYFKNFSFGYLRWVRVDKVNMNRNEHILKFLKFLNLYPNFFDYVCMYIS